MPRSPKFERLGRHKKSSKITNKKKNCFEIFTDCRGNHKKDVSKKSFERKKKESVGFFYTEFRRNEANQTSIQLLVQLARCGHGNENRRVSSKSIGRPQDSRVTYNLPVPGGTDFTKNFGAICLFRVSSCLGKDIERTGEHKSLSVHDAV